MKKSQFYSPDLTASGGLEEWRQVSDKSLSAGDLSGEFAVWTRQWAKLLGEQLDVALVWIALVDENKNANWIACWPDGNTSLPAIGERKGYFPLTYEGILVGWLFLVPDRHFDSELLKKVSELTPMVALGLFQEMKRLSLIKNLRQSHQGYVNGYNAMFEGLARILGLRDHETEEHTLRVTRLAMRLVEHIKIPPEEWDAIRRGCLLHDIGKLGVADAILLKPGSLTDTERRMMQHHVIYGFNILSPITNARQTLDVVLYHHERWDGKGYPEGLKGTQIPLVARLFAVVDVFDALTTDRPYRTAWLHDQALEYIKEQSGSHFDPDMVAAFLEIASRGLDLGE